MQKYDILLYESDVGQDPVVSGFSRFKHLDSVFHLEEKRNVNVYSCIGVCVHLNLTHPPVSCTSSSLKQLSVVLTTTI